MNKEDKNNMKLDATERKGCLSRRTFLAASGGISAALAATGLLEGSAMGRTSEEPSTQRATKEATAKAAKSANYPHLLSPLKIGNRVLKNRMIGSASGAHLLVGPEAYPNEAIMHHHADTARAGASIVVISQPLNIRPTTELDVLKIREGMPNDVNPDHGSDAGHFPYWDLANGGTQNLLSQLTEAVHFYGALCLWKVEIRPPAGYDVSGSGVTDIEVSTRQMETTGVATTSAPSPQSKKELTYEMLQNIIDSAALQAALGKECGFDGVWLHCAYRGAPTARLLSPLTNKRTDEYGGSLENRARFTVELADAIKKRCGKDFFIMAIMSGCEPNGGYTLDDGAEFARMFTGHIDLLALKGDPGERDSAPTNFIKERTPFLYMTEHYKKRGVTIPLVSDGGFTDLDLAEEAIASGKTDAVGMCRIFIANRNLIQLAVEGRGEDVVPCIRCNACHGNGYFSPWNTTCFVNPVYGIEHKIDRMISSPVDKKKVAVIGGGPAGMEAALVAASRGHSVVLYEKTGYLGGNFKKFESISFKWPHKDFKDYLVRQIGKSGIKVRLNVEASPEMITKEGYDAVIVAVGAEPIVPDIPGINGKNVIFLTEVFGKEGTLSKDVVVIGGGESGTETGMHLAEKGHNVTVVAETKVLAPDASRVHFYSAISHAWEQLPNFKFVLQAKCTGISENGVTYIDAGGRQQSIKAGSVVVAAGMNPKADVALKFYGTAAWFYTVGDCLEVGDLRTTMRSAFSTASML